MKVVQIKTAENTRTHQTCVRLKYF